jgi:acetyltransferase-like isoleucine patch superfamily enzyme
MNLIANIRRLRDRLKERRNAQLVDSCGVGTRLTGLIERRAPGGFVGIGDKCLILGQLVLERSESEIRIGNNTFVGGGTVVDSALSISIGDDVLLSYACIVSDCDSHSTKLSLRKADLAAWMSNSRNNWEDSAKAPIVIGRGAWIGARSIVLKGVTIGEGAVIGAGSVVTTNVPPFVVIGGNPARIIRELALNER